MEHRGAYKAKLNEEVEALKRLQDQLNGVFVRLSADFSRGDVQIATRMLRISLESLRTAHEDLQVKIEKL